jgi:hypothetical protein
MATPARASAVKSGPATPQQWARRGSFASLFSPGGLFSPSSGADSGLDRGASIEAIPGVEAICVQLQQMDQEYRALLADLEDHAVSECKAARQLAKAAEALALVAVVDGEGEGDWGVWSGLGSSLLAQSHLRLALCKTQAVAPAAEVRQRHLWEEGGALHTPAVALITAVRDLVDGVLARAVASRTQYRDTLAEASTQVLRLQNMHFLFVFCVFIC